MFYMNNMKAQMIFVTFVDMLYLRGYNQRKSKTILDVLDILVVDILVLDKAKTDGVCILLFARNCLKCDKIPLFTAALLPLNDVPTLPVAVLILGVQQLVASTIMPFSLC